MLENQSSEKEATMIYEVGRIYSVPCVQIISDLGWIRPHEWAPIIGPKHEDAEIIGFPYLHYHVDLRFLTKLQFECIRPYSTILHENDERNHYGPTPFIDKIVMRRRKCGRQFPHYPHERAQRWMRTLQERYRDTSLKCGKCPHRGLDLSNIKPLNGRIVCPGHGLVWDATSGDNIPYSS